MAQDSNHRAVRPDQPYSGDPAQGGRPNDPLAELARLIGQDDPFAGVSRPASRASAQDPHQPQDDQNAPHWLTRRAPEHYAGHDDQSADAQHDAAYDDPRYQHDPQYQHDPRYQDPQAYQSEEYYEDGQYYAEDAYEEPPKRRRGLKLVAAVAGVALLGTAGVYGYRAMSGPSTAGGEPPVIRADDTPMKTVPATASAPAGDSQLAAKPYDRGGDRGGERLQSREEQPVDPKAQTRGMQPPTPPKPPAGSVLPPLAPPSQTAALPNGAEPKKVQTITIRPDQSLALAPQSAPAPSAPPPPAPAPQQRVAPASPPPPATHVARADTGTYVQVASQLSEADAQASFKSLQQKYPSVLGSYQATIRRADLGEKGVRYRAQVGPFATVEEARQVCASLKSAGGQCFVPNKDN